ncbi:MAG: ABC transporter substrate-binding protein [Candidatus Polarisedimenticolaceae bacterium]|nr:ABC transporter substrate-binding protein [Candidatus Polarisedimenticolaceae bacterium]
MVNITIPLSAVENMEVDDEGISFLKQWLLLVLLSLSSLPLLGTEKIHLYLDADRTGSRASGVAIEQGIRTALSEVGDRLAGFDVTLLIRDHHGSSPRSRGHLEEYLADGRALALFSGLHSPPLLAHRQFINREGILLLDPWAAAGPITRSVSPQNWIFRLSVDDSKAGYVIAEHSIQNEGFKKPFLLLEETGWGRSNLKTMSRALEEMKHQPVGVAWFNWSLGDNAARIILRNIASSGADVIFMVANAPEGETFVRAMISLPEGEWLPIRSHWGITGGDFPRVINLTIREQIDLAFIQTRFSFINHADQPMAKAVLAQAQRLFPDVIKSGADIKAPTGFIHAYDLTRLLIAAVDQVGLSGDIKQDREKIRNALESLNKPVKGLIKTYQRPFRPYSDSDPDAHEALGRDDFVMARYGKKGEIILER